MAGGRVLPRGFLSPLARQLTVNRGRCRQHVQVCGGRSGRLRLSLSLLRRRLEGSSVVLDDGEIAMARMLNTERLSAC